MGDVICWLIMGWRPAAIRFLASATLPHRPNSPFTTSKSPVFNPRKQRFSSSEIAIPSRHFRVFVPECPSQHSVFTPRALRFQSFHTVHSVLSHRLLVFRRRFFRLAPLVFRPRNNFSRSETSVSRSHPPLRGRVSAAAKRCQPLSTPRFPYVIFILYICM